MPGVQPGAWNVVGKKGKVRYKTGGGGQGGQGRGVGDGVGGSVPSGSGGGGARNVSGGAVGGGFGGSRARSKLKPLETRAKLNERPNTVVIDGKGFAVLPSEVELAHFIDEAVLITSESKQLVTQIKSVYVDENKREYLIRI